MYELNFMLFFEYVLSQISFNSFALSQPFTKEKTEGPDPEIEQQITFLESQIFYLSLNNGTWSALYCSTR